MQWWQRSWEFVTQPANEIEDWVERQRASLFSAMLFLLTIMLVVATPFLYFLPNRQDIGMFFLALFIVLSMSCYGLSRTQYYKTSARFYIWLCIAILFYVGVTIDYANIETVLSFIAILIMMSAFLLTQRETIVAIAIVEAILLLLNIQTSLEIALVNNQLLIVGVGILALIFVNMSNFYRRHAYESEVRYRELMNANSEGIIVIDANDARILDINPAIVSLMGYQAENLIGRYPIEFVSEPFKASVWKIWNEKILNRPYELQVRHHKGYTVYVDVTLKSYSYRQTFAYVLTLVDATARKQTEKLLIESEKRFRAIFNQSFQQIGVLGRDGLILEINDTALRVLGIDGKKVFGKRLWDIKQLAPTSEARESLKAMVAAAATGQSIHEEITAQNLRQEQVYLDFSLKPVVDDDSQVNMLIAESRDITEQRLAEQKRIESELRYQALFNHTVDAVFIIGLEGNIITVNQHALDILGCEMQDVVGKSAQTFVIPEEQDAMLSRLSQLKAGHGFEGVYERGLKRKDGTRFRAEMTPMMVYDPQGQPLYIQSLVRDITERKKVEAERLRLLNAIESSLNEIYIFDADTLKFQFVNAGAVKNLGYAMEELVNFTPLDIKPLFTDEDFAALVKPLRDHQQEKITFETLHKRKDGSVYPVEIHLQLLEFGNERHFLAILSDVSERRKLEQGKFELRIAQERTQVLQSFIEQASHHFRTPITNIKTSMYVLPRVQDNPEKYQHHMTALNRETERLTRLIEDLLMMLRLQKTDTEYQIQNISIKQLLGEIQTIQEGQSYYEDYEWQWSFADEEIVVVGDKQFLSRALLNIIENAVSYSHKGDKISVTMYHEQSWIYIDIEDTGTGISDEDLPHVFDEFYRSYMSMEQDSTRSGLGLAITQHIIKRHRGTIKLKSAVGEGTRFQILLPLNLEWEATVPALP